MNCTDADDQDYIRIMYMSKTFGKLELGKLERVKLRDVWEYEAKDFTPWLAEGIKYQPVRRNPRNETTGSAR